MLLLKKVLKYIPTNNFFVWLNSLAFLRFEIYSKLQNVRFYFTKLSIDVFGV